jgi:YggT family protein
VLYTLVRLLFDLLTLLVLAHVVISWVPSARYHPLSMWVMRVTEPMLRPFRVMVRVGCYGALDFAPFILLLLLAIARGLVLPLLRGL